MVSPGFIALSPELLDALAAVAGTENVITDPAGLETLSKDYYWYSPVLKARLDERRASAAVKVGSREVLEEVIALAARAGVPITPRGAATGNYGQCIPLYGGLVVDLSGMDRILRIEDGVVTAEPGARLAAIENAARKSGWELRCYPSTWVKASLGGFIGGGSGGIGSITWGGLRDQGTIKRIQLLTVEETPRLVDLEEADTLQAFHSYGTTGFMVELEMRLAPARPWEQMIVAGRSWDALLDFAHAIATDDSVPKRLVTVLEDPIPSYFKPIRKFYPPDHHLIFLEIEGAHAEAVAARAAAAGLAVPHRIAPHEPRRSPMLSDYTWNHTTLWAIKADEQFTYLQSGFGDNFREQFALLRARFPGEILLHLEFARGRGRDGVFGKVGCGAIPLVRFRSEDRLREIIAYCTEIGVHTANPHTCYVDEGGRANDFAAQRALKTRTDPRGLLNPGKMRSHATNPFAAPGTAPEFLFPATP
jgi:FAD/FMN-containing dehydrogenase